MSTSMDTCSKAEVAAAAAAVRQRNGEAEELGAAGEVGLRREGERGLDLDP